MYDRLISSYEARFNIPSLEVPTGLKAKHSSGDGAKAMGDKGVTAYLIYGQTPSNNF